MAKTRRRRPDRRDQREREGARRFERHWRGQSVETIRAEAESLVNEDKALAAQDLQVELVEAVTAEKARRGERFSVQSPPSDEPTSLPNLIWWTGTSKDKYIPVSEYTNPKRQMDLALFALTAPLLLNAEAVLVKKCVSLDWYVEGGKTSARRWQEFFLNVEDYRGWDQFIARWVRAYSESDRGGYVEIVRDAPSWAVNEYHQLTKRGEAAFVSGADATWPIADLRVLDPVHCWPTRSTTWPLLVDNTYTGKKHRLRRHQFLHLLDMPSPNVLYRGNGICAASRAIWAAQEHRMIVRYCMEKMSENPGSGIVTANVNQRLLETALKSAKTERQARGVVYYKGLIFLPVLDPSGRFSLEFLSFSGLPDGFDRGQVYNILKEEVSAAFGIDVLELGSMPGNQLGSAQQATVMAKKSRGKGVGVIAQGIERAFRQRLLPRNVGFGFSSQDLEERMEKAEIDQVLFKNAALFAVQIGAPPELALQYLVDTEAVPKEYLSYVSHEDVTPDEIITDTEAEPVEGEEGRRGAEGERAWRPADLVKVYRDGGVKSVYPHLASYRIKQVDRVVPDGRPLPAATAADAKITERDIDLANRMWDEEMPEYAGLLDAG